MIDSMALIQERSDSNLLRSEHLSASGEKLKVVKVEKKSQYDKFKSKEIERYFLTLSNGKIFVIQNETNIIRLEWNFGTVESSLDKEIVLYKTQIEMDGRVIPTIRIRYNILNRINI